ncbi:MAG: hypothetical protein K2M94_07345 [Paramuribaculum sp.]|nr:hypothetical protein [Paramuribaculum sp.]
MTQNISATDKFSWNRVMVLARYYYPNLRTQLIIYPLVSLLSGIILYFTTKSIAWGFLSGALSLALSIMLYLGPIVFARKQTRPIETLIPARSSEKATFILGYSLVFIPIMVYLPQFLMFTLMYHLFPISSDFAELIKTSFEFNKGFYGLSYVQGLVPTITCLFVVYAKRNNRLVMACVWAMVAMIAQTIVSGILGAIIAIRQFHNIANPSESPEAFTTDFMYHLMPYLVTFFIICAVYVIIMAVFTVRNICKKQV